MSLWDLKAIRWKEQHPWLKGETFGLIIVKVLNNCCQKQKCKSMCNENFELVQHWCWKMTCRKRYLIKKKCNSLFKRCRAMDFCIRLWSCYHVVSSTTIHIIAYGSWHKYGSPWFLALRFSNKIMTYCPILCVQTSSSYWLWHACATITTSWSIQSIHLQCSIHVDGCNSFSVKAWQVIPKWMSHFYKWWNVIKSYMIIVLNFLWFGLKYL